MAEPSNAWMETQRGLRFNPTDPNPQVSLKDMMWGVARMPRYNGQFREDVDHFSVAEHLVLLVRYAMDVLYPGKQLVDLSPSQLKEIRTLAMHDLQEGVLGDMTRPMKKLVPQFCEVEDMFCRKLAVRFDLIFPLPTWIKNLDNRIIHDERRQAMATQHNTWSCDDLQPLGVTLEFWTPRQAYRHLRDIYLHLDLGLEAIDI